ncbi:MAG TPA: hypothetical protein VKA60_17285 [Blastocatellia bacterium]|nr:hypothetical protein [Blastocatellia bacterium]
MRYRTFLVIVFLAWCFCPDASRVRAAALGASQLILVDGSGSMAGFFATGEIQRLDRTLSAQPGAPTELSYFVEASLVGREPTTFGSSTLLDNALNLAIERRPAILWIVTDNQPSVGGQTASDKDLDAFYSKLASDAVKRIYLFPLKLRFKGRLFTEDDKTLTDNYDNLRGLLVYALLLDERVKDEFEGVVHDIEAALVREFPGNVKSIFVKPLSQNSVAASLKTGNRLQFKDGVMMGRDFETGRPIEGDFTLELTSQLNEIAIEKSTIGVSVPVEFQTGDFNVSGLKPKIDPTSVALQPKGKAVFKIALRLDSVDIRKTPATLWNAIMHNRGVITGNIRLTIDVPKQNFTVAGDLEKNFGTDKDVFHNIDPNIQSRIYGLTELVRKMIPSGDMVHPRVGDDLTGNIPVRLEVRYPKWPTWAAIMLLGLPLLAAVASTVLVRLQPFYRLTWAGKKYRPFGDFRLWPFLPKSVDIDDRAAARITMSPLAGIKVKALRGYTVDDLAWKFLRGEGTEFIIRREADGALVDFRFASAHRRVIQSGTRNDVFGDSDYGSQETAVSWPVDAGVPPIRRVTTGTKSVGAPTGPSSSDDYEPYTY